MSGYLYDGVQLIMPSQMSPAPSDVGDGGDWTRKRCECTPHFGYGESNPELPRRTRVYDMRGGNVDRYTISDDLARIKPTAFVY